jgi:hypothetical protein
MRALVVIAEHEVLCDLLHFPTVGEAITVDGQACVVDGADMVPGTGPGAEHELLVLCHLDSVPHESPST